MPVIPRCSCPQVLPTCLADLSHLLICLHHFFFYWDTADWWCCVSLGCGFAVSLHLISSQQTQRPVQQAQDSRPRPALAHPSSAPHWSQHPCPGTLRVPDSPSHPKSPGPDLVKPHRLALILTLHPVLPGVTGNGFETKEVAVKESVTPSCPTLATPWTRARQTPLSKLFSRQEYWSG